MHERKSKRNYTEIELLIVLLLAGDIELNPGPQLPVTSTTLSASFPNSPQHTGLNSPINQTHSPSSRLLFPLAVSAVCAHLGPAVGNAQSPGLVPALSVLPSSSPGRFEDESTVAARVIASGPGPALCPDCAHGEGLGIGGVATASCGYFVASCTAAGATPAPGSISDRRLSLTAAPLVTGCDTEDRTDVFKTGIQTTGVSRTDLNVEQLLLMKEQQTAMKTQHTDTLQQPHLRLGEQ
uniref:Uncharacterized protein n=1 Tax=Knipowitschia caucasica TaxID=637954 RepID=A0AAV2MD59_KNICA